MKKIIYISLVVIVTAAVALGIFIVSPTHNTALPSKELELKLDMDPRYTTRSVYHHAIIDLSKKYGDKKSHNYDAQQSFDLYLSYFLMSYWDIYTHKDCSERIEKDYAEYHLLLFKTEAKENLKSYCSYSISELINTGDQYKKKAQGFDYNTLSAMHFYYNAYIRATHEYLDDDYNEIPTIVEQSRESFTKFRMIRNQLPDHLNYIQVFDGTPFNEVSTLAD